MAKNYTTGTINQPDAGSVGLAMANKIRDDVVAHDAWELVEEFTAAAGLARWMVFKCLAAQSGLPLDFFVVLGRTLSNGELRFAICEEYTAAGHLMEGFAGYPGNTNYNFDEFGRRPETYTLGAALFATPMNYWKWIPAGTSTKWWLIVSEDSFVVAFNGPSNGFVSTGVYIPLTPTPIDMPIQMCGSDGSYGPSIGGITRNPKVAGSNSPGYSTGFDRNSVYLGFRGDLRYNDRLQDGQRPVAEVALTLMSGSNDWPAQYGWALGKQKGMAAGQNSVAGFAFGDAYALGGSLWVPYLPTDFHLWDTGVASS